MRVFWHIARAALLGAVLSAPALAQGWGSFYEPSQKNAVTKTARTLAAKGGPEGVCIREILAAQTRHGIPDNLLLAIGLQEAGTRRNGHFTVWPYAVNAAGEGRLFDNRNAALDWVAERQASGIRSIDVGCMQINMRWHPDAFASVSEGFDPRVNVDYAARFLKRLHRRTGSWMQAAGSYHSFEPSTATSTLTGCKRTSLPPMRGCRSFRRWPVPARFRASAQSLRAPSATTGWRPRPHGVRRSAGRRMPAVALFRA